MDRLTMTSDRGGLAFTFALDITCKRSEMCKIIALGERLKAYEETGLTPEEILALRTQPKNKPLTLDELGQLREAQIPIWMGRAKEWIFVASVADAPYAQVWYFNAKGFAQTALYHHEKFYRSKPREE